ncbi:MAG: 50S ribosomal protein L11 methyltransferase [Victivallaceae bacterium]
MNDLLYCCKMRDESGSFEAAAELFNALEFEFSSWENREERTVYHTVYATGPEAGRDNFERLKTLVREWREYGVELSEPEYFELKKEDWAEVWKKYFPILPISDKLVIKPSWLEYTPKPGQAVVEIDPGMSFGTGQHATTSFCLYVLDRLAGDLGVRGVLDAGCGSGILAIAAAKLGYDPVDAFDYDPDAVRIAAENFALNAITSIKPEVADAAVYRGRQEGYDLVCANILGHLLRAYKLNIASWVRPGKYLALAGILSTEFDALAAEYTALGFCEIERRDEKEWTSGLFRKTEG